MKIEIDDYEHEPCDQHVRPYLVLIPESPCEEIALTAIRERLDRRCVNHRRIGLTQLAVRLHQRRNSA